MSATYRRRSHREATSAGSAGAAGQRDNAHAGEAADRIARLDVLAAHLRARGWTIYINTPAGRLASLFVQGPHDRAECGDIIAIPDSTTDDWWYWFSWAERIAPVHPPAAAADAIITACGLLRTGAADVDASGNPFWRLFRVRQTLGRRPCPPREGGPIAEKGPWSSTLQHTRLSTPRWPTWTPSNNCTRTN